MITVYVRDLFIRSAELLSDGVTAVKITKYEADEDFPASLNFEPVDDENDFCVEYEPIYCSDSPDAQEPPTLYENTPLPITLDINETKLISAAMHDAIASCKKKLDDTSLSADEPPITSNDKPPSFE